MSATTVLVMCNGQQRRLPKLTHPKHLLEVGGETILGRTLRLLDGFNLALRAMSCAPFEQVVVVGPVALSLTVDQPRSYRIVHRAIADGGSCIVDGLLSVRAEMCSRTVVLLGDVVWSRAALSKVLAEDRSLVFAGTPVLSASEGEVFALVFDNPQGVSKLCETCPCRVDGTRTRTFTHPQGGHLRRLLWHAQAVERLGVAAGARQTWHPGLYLPIDDWTDDIDTQVDVDRLPHLAQCIAIEDRGRS